MLLGASGVAQLRENLGALDLLPRLDAAAVARIEAAVDGAVPRDDGAGVSYNLRPGSRPAAPAMHLNGHARDLRAGFDRKHAPISLDRIHAGPGRLVAKAEFLQPGGSVKDRAAKAILLAARAMGASSRACRWSR